MPPFQILSFFQTLVERVSGVSVHDAVVGGNPCVF
jgi:hypothetical protein